MNNPFMSALVVIGLGAVARRLGVLGEGAGRTMSRLILNITLPAVVLTAMAQAQLPRAALALPVLAVAWGLVMWGVGTVLFSQHPVRQGGVMALALLGFNIGQFAYPLVEGAWGADALALLVMFDIGNALVIFGLGYTLAGMWTGRAVGAKDIFRRLVTFVPLLSYIVALALNLLGIALPRVISAPLGILGAANSALVLLLVGMYLVPGVIIRCLKEVGTIVAVRYGSGLAVGLALYTWLPVSQLVRSVLLAAFLLPVGMSVIPYALEHDLDTDLAGALVNSTLIISFGMLWAVFAVVG